MKTGVYRHYNGNLYQVIGVSRHSETLEEFVVYQRLYEDYALWIRPRAMFEELVTINGKTMPRFEFLKDCFTHAPRINTEKQHQL